MLTMILAAQSDCSIANYVGGISIRNNEPVYSMTGKACLCVSRSNLKIHSVTASLSQLEVSIMAEKMIQHCVSIKTWLDYSLQGLCT